MYFQSFVIYTIILLELKLQHMNTDWTFDIILGRTGMQLIFFTADHTVVRFQSVIKKLLITHRCSGYCLNSDKSFSAPHSVPVTNCCPCTSVF